MEDFYAQFVALCTQLCFEKDYLDKSKLRKHNAAVTKLGKLKEKILKTDCIETIRSLLLHEDERVRLSAAIMCLKQLHGLEEEAKRVAQEIADSSLDPFIRFEATFLLETLNPESTFYGW